MNLRVIIIILSFLVILATAIGGNLFYSSTIKSTLNAAHKDANEQTKKIAVHVDNIILENQKSIITLAGHNKLLQALISKDPTSISEANAVLDLFQQSLDINVSYLMDSDGYTVASSNRNDADSFVGKNYSFRPYFQEAMIGKASVYMALGITSKIRGVYFGYPVYGDNKGRPAGVAVIKTSVSRICEEMGNSYQGIMTVTDPHGLIFMSSDDSMLYRTLWQLSEDTIKEITNSKQFGKGPWNWTGIEIDNHNHDHGINEQGIKYHIHEAEIHSYHGWKAVYLHTHGTSAQRISIPIFKTTWVIIIILLLIMATVLLLYKKASNEITARKELEEKLRETSITDELTGIYNRRGFFELAGHQYHTATRNNDPMSLFYLDIDDMKDINDKYSHKEGDNALKDISEILRTTFRKSDVMARLGGDEFAVLMVRSPDYKSENISNRLENTINDHNHTHERPYKLSVSIGEVVYDPEKPLSFDEFIQIADKLMYAQKKNKEIV